MSLWLRMGANVAQIAQQPRQLHNNIYAMVNWTSAFKLFVWGPTDRQTVCFQWFVHQTRLQPSVGSMETYCCWTDSYWLVLLRVMYNVRRARYIDRLTMDAIMTAITGQAVVSWPHGMAAITLMSPGCHTQTYMQPMCSVQRLAIALNTQSSFILHNCCSWTTAFWRSDVNKIFNSLLAIAF